MNTETSIKERLVREIDQLPEDQLRAVLDFIARLQRQAAIPAPEQQLDPDQDPLLGFIGGASHGTLANDIDQALYETPP